MAATPRNIIDMVSRDLIQEAPLGFFALAGIPVEASLIRFEDISVILPELQADKVLVVNEPSPWALYAEFQKKPAEDEIMEAWPVKQIALKRRLKMPVSLVVYYLHRGDRATFPDHLILGHPSLPSEFRFPTVRLWERVDEIRQNYPALAPLLLVTADEPTERTLREVKGIIDGLEDQPEKRDNLYGLTAMLAMHYFEDSLVRAAFGPKFEEIKKMGSIDRWLEEKYEEGISQGARQMVLRLLADKFGQIPEVVAAQVQLADSERCQQLNLMIARAGSLEDLDLS